MKCSVKVGDPLRMVVEFKFNKGVKNVQTQRDNTKR